jgi:hypothetical protein
MRWHWLWRLRFWFRVFIIAASAAAVAFLTAWAALNALDQHDVVNRATLLSLAIAAIAVGISLPTVVRPQSRLSAADVAAAADELARRVRSIEENERARLLGRDTKPIDVGFELVRMPSRNALGAGPAGSLDEIRGYYDSLSPRRLVIIGKPGSGKTLLALELLLRMLEDRVPGGPVPVRFSLSRWPEERALHNWLAEEMAAAYRLPPPVARSLLTGRLVIPVLDGLDEMDLDSRPPVRAAAALAAMNSELDGTRLAGMIVTCREESYRRLADHRHLAGPTGTRLLDAATVLLDDVTAAQAIRYIRDRVVAPDSWELVIDDLSRERGSGLAAALNTPWRLTLATTVYERSPSPPALAGGTIEGAPSRRDGSRQPAPIADDGHDHSPVELIEHAMNMDQHLLRDYVRVATDLHPRQNGRVHKYERVERWLAEFAIYLRRNASTERAIGGRRLATTDVVLHELWPIAGSTAPRRVDAILGAAVSVPGFVWLAAFAFSRALPWRVLFFVVLAGYAAALWRRSAEYWRAPQPMDYRQLVSWRGVAQLGLGTGAGIIAALLFTPWAGAAVAFGAWVAGGLSLTPTQGLVTRVRRDSGPLVPLRHDLRLSLVAGIAAAPAVGLAFSRYLGPVAGWLCGSGYAVVAGLTVAEAPWRRYLALLLCTRGRLPWRLGQFLDWAYDAGLMRVSGIAYQFRHQELQNWLAGAQPGETHGPNRISPG